MKKSNSWTDQYILHTYKRNPVAIDHGKGAKLYDTEGKEYIDFTSGIGVCSLGYGNEAWAKAIYDQALKLGHISNLYYTSALRRSGLPSGAPERHERRILRQFRRRGQRRHDQAGPEIFL